MPITQDDIDLARIVGEYYDDPLGFVRDCYPWGEPGPLERETGPDKWQVEFLSEVGRQVKERKFNGHDPVLPQRHAVASGHGIGKSALVAWLVNWIMSTRPLSKGTITANTFTQLETKTWAEIKKWTKLCITSSWFDITDSAMRHKDNRDEWRCSPQSCAEENSESFAGQHAPFGCSFYFADEASAVPDKIFEVAEGGLTDGEPMIFMFGNPTKNSGKLHRCVFGPERPRWTHRSIDSRDSGRSNKRQIQEWIEDWGEDSDFVRVRVRGLAPRADESQFIDSERVAGAQTRMVYPLEDDPLICGLDVSGGGSAYHVFRFRRGLDGRTIPPVRIPGEHGDREKVISRAAIMLKDGINGRKIDMMFVDSAFGSPIVERLRVLGYRNVGEVNFGETKTPDPHMLNMRAYMYNETKDWLGKGAIEPNGGPRSTGELIEVGLLAPGAEFNRSGKLVLEPKQQIQERIGFSPDDADALALTFAQRVAPRKSVMSPEHQSVGSAWS